VPDLQTVVLQLSTSKSSVPVDLSEKQCYENLRSEWLRSLGSVDGAAIFSVLAALIGLDPSSDLTAVKVLAQHPDLVWTEEKYKDAFKKTPELQELTDTPFMTQIVTQILPDAENSKASDREIKSRLVRALGEFIVDLLWATLTEEGILKDLGKIQEEFDDTKCTNRVQRERIRDVARDAAKYIMEVIKKNDARKSNWETSLPETLKGVLLEDEGEKVLALELDLELVRQLKRRPTRRAAVYELFIRVWANREIAKNAGRGGGLAPEKLRVVAANYSRELGVTMVREGRTKLRGRSEAELFATVSDTAIFFSNDPLASAARSAAPVRQSGGFLYFVHKTVQEYSAASALSLSLDTCFERIGKKAGDLDDLIKKGVEPAGAVESSPRELIASARTTAKCLETLNKLLTSLASSPLSRLNLKEESAVCDFILDLLMDDPFLMQRVHAAAYVAIKYLTDPVFSEVVGGKVDNNLRLSFAALLANVETLLTGPLPRRNNGTLLHEAAAAGNLGLVKQALTTLRLVRQACESARGFDGLFFLLFLLSLFLLLLLLLFCASFVCSFIHKILLLLNRMYRHWIPSRRRTFVKLSDRSLLFPLSYSCLKLYLKLLVDSDLIFKSG